MEKGYCDGDRFVGVRETDRDCPSEVVRIPSNKAAYSSITFSSAAAYQKQIVEIGRMIQIMVESASRFRDMEAII